jgi:TRAP-type mannitol/chloroaromatic compound transport system permease large subunit
MAPELIGVVMIAVMLFAIFVGFPISFTLIFLGFVFGSWGFGADLVFYLMALQFNQVMLEQTLAAVPLFVFMGIMMEQAGLMERLFRSVQLMLASTRGSLYIAVLFVSTIFAAASNFFGAVFSRLGTPTMLTELLLQWDLSQMQVLIIIMALIFLLGWPLEWVPIVLIIVPILIPALEQLDVNLTWFGILVAVNLQTAWLSPLVALSAYFLKGVVPEWDLKDIYVGMMQFMVIQLIGLILVLAFPQIALWLPTYIYGG